MTTEQVDARSLLNSTLVTSALVTGIDHVGIAVPDLDAAIVERGAMPLPPPDPFLRVRPDACDRLAQAVSEL